MDWVHKNVKMQEVVTRKMLVKHLVNEIMKNRRKRIFSPNVPYVSQIHSNRISEGKPSNPTGFPYCLAMTWPPEPDPQTPAAFLPWQKHK